ncbi:unnamed protein product [Zymoseptoria tritici ST99CH_1A5]|uniref:NmrA-like domain-containing protein n=3 Tax=Zymoseptoria tritici TaxID=1047171 RepID=A0A1X7RL32_ZYMT9|nr:unnamed protein product [Zymoseptoria tritici ST99CH_3D7]SMR46685.1 unnamed protein product [Zymoseptoria tritici ST99CH_1E4]SMY21830.1 unnamed protein product [Zymoseptoria tritici ST99CH_1A5]
MATKLITIVGITGTQGASVADAYINEPGWKIRGISRDPSKASSKAWTDQGVDMVFADLDDIGSLKTAFSGSNVICGVTDFWQQMQDKGNQERAKRTGKTINVISFEAEIQQGRNIVDAAQSTIVTLDMLVLSVLTDSRKWSGGKITWNYHFESKWRIVEYLQENYPGLHGKSSFFQAACYLSNLDTTLAPRMVSFKLFGVYMANAAEYGQTPEGYIMSLPIDGNKPVPMIDARNDTGPLVKALVKAAPGKNLMGYTSEISFNEIAQI